MASLRKTAIKAGAPRWQVRWRQDGRSVSETFPTESGAIKFRGLVDAAGQRYPQGWVPGRGFAPALARPTLAQWFDRAIASRSGANPRTRQDYGRDFRRNVPGWLADMAIGDITREDVGRWLIELQSKGLSGKSIPVRHEQMCFLTPGEYGQFREFVAAYYRPFIDLLFTTGLRFGEATALLPQHIDLEERRLHVVTAWKLQPGGQYLSQEPKTRMARRTLSLTERQVQALEGLIRPGELIFRNHRGDRIQQSTFHGDTWTPALVKAAAAGFVKRPRPHDLRHSHAAYLLSSGRPMLAVSRRLGHASITTTNDRYGHLLPQVDLDVISAMDQIGY